MSQRPRTDPPATGNASFPCGTRQRATVRVAVNETVGRGVPHYWPNAAVRRVVHLNEDAPKDQRVVHRWEWEFASRAKLVDTIDLMTQATYHGDTHERRLVAQAALDAIMWALLTMDGREE